MVEITLVRHGQANNTATTEADYDRLSDLGRQQSRWLGEWLRDVRAEYDLELSGGMTRHLHTAAEMVVAPEADPRWNELSYHPLAAAYQAETGETAPAAGVDFPDYFAGLMTAWSDNRLPDVPETFAGFQGRVFEALEDARATGGRIIVVTSGGVIGQVVGKAMGLDLDGVARLALGIGNTSVQRLIWTGRRWGLSEFGATPHLAHADRLHARTFY